MDPSIRRVEPEAGIQGGAVRRVGPRRERPSKEDQEFAEELSRETGSAEPEGKDPEEETEERRDVDLTVSPPDDDETGTRIDLVG